MPKPVEQPEVDLPDPEDLCFPDPVAPESEPEMDLVGIEQPCIPEPEGNLVASPEPKLDLVDPQESRVSQTESTKEMTIKKVPGFIVTRKVQYTTVRTVKKMTS
ncbi:UDP-N-acetylglucosamine 1-carboxyvinyltransferase [Labeo rohita]|uniref:UDP-N-acetylglucosamine 1-carboxyvinyltransferase n=1 Tax=Labeo rohita TaxID=84645 RepID=A0ABQ8LF74_LABRO|nr:UDP-N-acetylglucosamine 1-carboxyvinyltransferase [Labeo rohita]